MSLDKQTKISKQVRYDSSSDAPDVVTFSSVNDAKNFYYTAKELALFDTWCDNVQWAVINDGDNKATWLKVTMDFDTEGKAVSWHSALDDIRDELTSHLNGLSNSKSHRVTIEESTDHLF